MRRALGGLVVVIAMLCVSATAAAADRIFWTNGPYVVAGNLDGSGQANFNIAGTTLNTGYGITIEPKRRWLVFIDNNDPNSSLQYARLDGGGGGSLGDGDPGAGTFLSGPTGVTIDSVGDRAFVTNPTNSTLAFVPLDPSVGGNVFTSGGTKNGVYGITLDPSTQTLWWAAYGDNKIAYAHLSDHTGAQLTTGSATLNSPRGVAIDSATGTIYWANAGANKISYAKLNGSGGNDLTLPGTAPISNPRGVAIDVLARKIYWVNDAGSIAWSTLDGGAGGKLYDTDIGARFAVIQYSPRNTSAPAVSGGSDTGSVLSCSNGTWLADSPEAFFFAAPTAFAYQWTLDGNEIAGANASSVTASAPGSYSCRVTASNEAGSAAQASNAHAVTASPVTAPTPGGSNPPPVLPALTKPILSALKETNAVFSAASASTPLTGKTSAKRKQGTVFSFRLDKAATVTIVIRRKKPGKPAKVATLKRTARPGLNKVKFTGRIRKRALKPGTYAASFTAKNTAGSSATRSLTFKIVRR